MNGELKQFTLATSHDLRSPLSTLRMAFELLDLSKVGDSETRHELDILKDTGSTLNKYVDALSATMSGQSQLEDIDLTESLPDVLQSISALVVDSKAVVRTDFSAFSTVHFDRSRMDSILLNLITNSIRYAKPDVPPVILVRAEIVNGVKRLIVADNGVGFDMATTQDRIFGINQTFHDHEDSKGVGLYPVHSHVTSLGGQISVESQINEGTRFTISFKDSVRSSDSTPGVVPPAGSLHRLESTVRFCVGI